MNPHTKNLIIALDKMSMRKALNLVAALGNSVYGFKAHDLFDDYGTRVTMELLREECPNCWVLGDIKGLDTVDTVKERARKLRKIGVNAVTIHALGKPEMIAAAVESGLTVIAVTLLSDWSDDFVRTKFRREPNEWAVELALEAKGAGAQGIVCSPTQVGNLSGRAELLGLKYAVPGTRSAGEKKHDQAQVRTPLEAVRDGADYLVIGRQATHNPDPAAAVEAIAEEIEPALEERNAAVTA
jgi:orotidine-5'-phosphate decarboxylase